MKKILTIFLCLFILTGIVTAQEQTSQAGLDKKKLQAALTKVLKIDLPAINAELEKIKTDDSDCEETAEAEKNNTKKAENVNEKTKAKTIKMKCKKVKMKRVKAKKMKCKKNKRAKANKIKCKKIKAKKAKSRKAKKIKFKCKKTRIKKIKKKFM